HVEDVGRAGRVARREGHLAHRVDDRARIEGRDVDVLDGLGEQFSFCVLARLRNRFDGRSFGGGGFALGGGLLGQGRLGGHERQLQRKGRQRATASPRWIWSGDIAARS